tara:strand:- start:805 stop:1446 length:642 start_codon:yes stop_codon:yes gene_type:complete
MSLSFEDCLQNINQKYNTTDSKNIHLLKENLFRENSLLLYFYSINNFIHSYLSFAFLEDIVNDIDTFDSFISEYNHYVNNFEEVYHSSSKGNQKTVSFLKERMDSYPIQSLLDTFLCKKYKGGNLIYGKINYNIHKLCRTYHKCIKKYDVDIMDNYICPDLEYNMYPNYIDGNTYHECCKSSMKMYIYSLLSSYKLILFILMGIFLFKKLKLK